MSAGCGTVCAIYTDGEVPVGGGAALGNRFLKGSSTRLAMREGINWKELWALEESLQVRGDLVRGKLVLLRLDNATAVAYANRAAGWLAALTRRRDNSVAAALSMFPLRATGGDPCPDRDLRDRFGTHVESQRGDMGVDMMARGDGANAWGPTFRSPSKSALEVPPPPARLRQLPSVDMVGLALGCIFRAVKEGWRGAAFCLVLSQARREGFLKLSAFERALRLSGSAALLVGRARGRPVSAQIEEDADWVAMRMEWDSNGGILEGCVRNR